MAGKMYLNSPRLNKAYADGAAGKDNVYGERSPEAFAFKAGAATIKDTAIKEVSEQEIFRKPVRKKFVVKKKPGAD